jgi:hypothetical protein
VALAITILTIIGLSTVMLMGGVPDMPKQRREWQEGSREVWKSACSYLYALTWTFFQSGQLASLLLSTSAVFLAYHAVHWYFGECMQPWSQNHSTPLLHLVALPTFAFQPVLAQRFAVILIALSGFSFASTRVNFVMEKILKNVEP